MLPHAIQSVHTCSNLVPWIRSNIAKLYTRRLFLVRSTACILNLGSFCIATYKAAIKSRESDQKPRWEETGTTAAILDPGDTSPVEHRA
jgi:hypothetical protein